MTARRMGPRNIGRAVIRGVAALKRSMYRGGRPNAFMRLVNRLDVLVYRSRLLSPRHAAVLKVVGRRSGNVTSVAVAVTEHRGAEFLVSMLGPDANWVRNVQTAGGKAALWRQGREIPVMLEEVPPERRAEILRRYLAVAPGARPHLGLEPTAPLAKFRQIAPRHPAFRILERPARTETQEASK
ncbi:nitroreductase/quinone reductase family protein [Streptosporangium sp. NPDC087985]|uniref:nitroreductase/quinone reductase family protein n=1 Tax=Streptosporangium sp. NPDC087985 TaxID=3366196 RepID=UPI003807ED8B